MTRRNHMKKVKKNSKENFEGKYTKDKKYRKIINYCQYQSE